uniref:HIVEP zinc finger 2 n=1 Tax=Latimeria chalumnae TaxID=7897 RepID=H3ACU2_LATCH
MEPEEITKGLENAVQSRENFQLQSRWRSESSVAVKMSTYSDQEGQRQPHTDVGQAGSKITAQLSSPGKLQGSSDADQRHQEKHYQQQVASTYSYQYSHFPQQSLPHGLVHKAKSQHSLEGQAWHFSSHLQSVASEDFFSLPSRGHGGGFLRKKTAGITSPFGQYPQKGAEQLEDVHKKEQKPKKPGKYVCHYCGRACAKPSVLKKHIRSHTGERPYPCAPCGFSFKTKSNLYKHRKSHAHAIKAGLVPFSEASAARAELDAVCPGGEPELQSDAEQTTDTDEENTFGGEISEKMSPGSQISFERDKNRVGIDSGVAGADSPISVDDSTVGTVQVPILIVPKGGFRRQSESPQFIETEMSQSPSLPSRADESQAVKQRLALRLNEKKGQDSEQSLNLLSPHSKGSTDSGYFSRSESAEQQVSPPNTNVKSYEEIMFGKYYRLNPRAAVTVATATYQEPKLMDKKEQLGSLPIAGSKLGIRKIIEEHISQLITHNEAVVDPRPMKVEARPYPGSSENTGDYLDVSSDTAPLIRSNSMPTSSATNLNVPQSLRGSHSFDERMTGSDDVFYPGNVGLSHQRTLIRQAAFEVSSAHDGHSEADYHGKIMTKNMLGAWNRSTVSEKSSILTDKEIHAVSGSEGMKSGGSIFENRKRRKEKSVGDEDEVPVLYSGISVGTMASAGDCDSKLYNIEAVRSASVMKGYDYSAQSQSESFEICSSTVVSEDVHLPLDSSNRKAGGNVISVIQHTNSLSRPSSFEKSESTENISYQQDKPLLQSESCDTEINEPLLISEHTPKPENIELVGRPSQSRPLQQYPIQPRLVRQHNIQVPEIRVTEEPDKPEKNHQNQPKEQEKVTEEFQWPQRSETLSQLPAEKLPPKKKRLRLAEMEYSSGESSFESTCTSLSRSPSQESNLSHSSSFSVSLDRDESIKSATLTKQEEFGKQAELLLVPGSSHSLVVPTHQSQKEMRRSSSEQTPCPHPTELPEVRSKSFDYGSLSHSSGGTSYAASSTLREKRRYFLVRQASLSGYPESSQLDQGGEQSLKQEQLEQMHHSSSSALHTLQPVDSVEQIAGSQPHAQSLTGSQQKLQEAFRHPLPQQTPYPTNKYPIEQQNHLPLLPHQEMMQIPLVHSSLPRLPYPSVCLTPVPVHQSMFWQSPPESLQGHLSHQVLQQLQKSHIRKSILQPIQQEAHPPFQFQHMHPNDQKYQRYSGTTIQHSKDLASLQTDHIVAPASTTLSQSTQTLSTTQKTDLQQPLSGMLVPVRIQTHVPTYGSVMYTSVSQVIVTHAQSTSSAIVICRVDENMARSTLATTAAMQGIGLNLSHMFGQHRDFLQYPLWKVPQPLPVRLDSAIPLCLTSSSDTVSTLGGSKRMLSPASSLELFMETKQQKRVKEEKMYGQIVEELSAVELNNSHMKKETSRSPKPLLVRQLCTTELKEGLSSSSSQDSSLATSPTPTTLETLVQTREKLSGVLLSSGQRISSTPRDRQSPEDLDIDESASDMSLSPQSSSLASSENQQEGQIKQHQKFPVSMLVQLAANKGGAVVGSTILLTDVADPQQLLQFPSLRTTTNVSWCFLNYTKPNHVQQTPHNSSVYDSWCISSYNLNPPGMTTKASLALLRSKQNNNNEIYSVAAMHRPGTGKVVSSSAWKEKFAQKKPDPCLLDSGRFEKKLSGNFVKERLKEETAGNKDIVTKQTEPTRIKIFEGGYKSNEDYVYVRGRGRGKYICEECGIRCKKPSMLKKHIRTHTDVRPYVCKFCNFAFKTKGNLTKHMKSKAHMKKCLELGVSVTSVDEADTEETENAGDLQREGEKADMRGTPLQHQFSDAEESDGVEEEGDENDDDEDDDEDDFEEHLDDSTPKTRSRSTSPQPPKFSSVSATQNISTERAFSNTQASLISYLVTLPSIQITPLPVPSNTCEDAQMTEYQRLFKGSFADSENEKDRLDVPNFMDEVYVLSPDHSSSTRDSSPSRHTSSSRQSSPGYDSSPCRDDSPKRYLSLRRDISPRRHLSPRRDISPRRHFSPKRESSLRRELSPRRDASPRRHLSPRRDASLGRSLSPGKEISSRRELSPRREKRYLAMMRATSPRQASYHSTYWSMNPQLYSEPLSLGQSIKTGAHSEMDMRTTKWYKGNSHGCQTPSLFSEVHRDYIFSHLPLHSQQQVRAPFPMIPVGGIQMVHSVPASLSGLQSSSALPLSKSNEMAFVVEDIGKEAQTSTKQWEKHFTPQLLPLAVPSDRSSSSFSVMKQKTSEEVVEITDRRNMQDHNIQTCTKAIASLRIGTEEASPPEGEQLSKVHEYHTKTLESAPINIKHFSGSEASREMPSASATKPDLHSEKDCLAHSTFYSKSVEGRLFCLTGMKEMPAMAQEGKDSSAEK